MKILLMMPWCPEHRRYRSLLSPFISYRPLTLPTLAALVPKTLHAQVDVCDEMATDYHRFLKKQYDIVAISCASSESNRAYEAANDFRRQGAYIALGGYHMLHCAEEGMRHADTVLSGPGELAWPRFLKDFAAGRPQRFYCMPNVPPHAFVTPDVSVLPTRKYLRFPTILANPGCPHHCGFCVIHSMWKNSEKRRIEQVVEELRQRRGRIVIFYDPNFFGDRDYAIALMRAMIPLRRRWVGAACISVAQDEELLCLAEQSGCAGLLVGLESMQPEALRGVQKGFNDPQHYHEAIRRLQAHGINVNGCFVLGLDSDTEQTLLSLPRQVEELELNLARFSLLTPVPGSELYQNLKREGRIRTENWTDYSQDRVVFRPQNMTPERLQEIYLTVWKETYRMRAVLRRVHRAKTRRPIEKLVALATNLGFKFLGKDM